MLGLGVQLDPWRNSREPLQSEQWRIPNLV